MGRPNRFLAAAVAVLLAVVGVATAFAVTRTPEHFEAGTAVATVQAYLAAIAGQDPTAAGALLDPGGPCAASDVEMAYLPEQFRAVLVSQDVGAETPPASGSRSARAWATRSAAATATRRSSGSCGPATTGA